MTLGEKIRAARMEKHMTQKDLVGTFITRNMLSKIENGSATPSVKTLEYLAGKLELPAGYFMSESAGDELTPGGMASARDCYSRGEYDACISVLKSMDLDGGYRDEAMMLLSRAEVNLSKQAMVDGKYDKSIEYARDALSHNDASLYQSAALRTELLLLIARCTMELNGDFEAAMEEYQAAYQDQGLGEFYRLTMAEYYIGQGRYEEARSEMEHITRLKDENMAAYLMLQGRMEIEDSQYETAAKQLQMAEELAKSTGSNFFMSGLYAMLEQCYREMEDFKMAYHYASMQLKIKE